MAIGYCASCGMRRDIYGGLCRQCSSDMTKGGRKVENVDFPLTIDGVVSNARRYTTYMAFAFLAAACIAIDDGSAYGW